MTWEEYRNNDMREQEQLDVARALLEDATRDTVLWLQANPSAEERTHVLATQGRLADLARIIERRMERRKEPRDDWQWSKGVHEVLSRLLKAREARGGVVGESWERLAKRLPRELPGSQLAAKPRPKVPEPVKTVNTGFTSVGLTKAPRPPSEVGGRGDPYQPKPTEVPHDPPMYFPSDLWPRTNVILLKAQRRFPLQTQTVELCKHIVCEMTPLFVETAKAGKMKAADVLREHGGGMNDLLRLLLVHNDPGPRSGWGISDAAYRLGEEVRKSAEWLRLGEAIAEAPQSTINHAGSASKPAPSPSAASPEHDGASETEQHSYREQIEKYSRWTDTELAVRFGEAGQYVKELCEIERKLHGNWARRSETALELRENREKHAQFLLRDLGKRAESPSQRAVGWFRDAIAAEFRDVLAGISSSDTGITNEPALVQNNEKTTPQKNLTTRETRLWEIIRRGQRGAMYCREVDAAKITLPRKGVLRGAPRTYLAAYRSGDKRLVHWIQNEKSKIRRKAELLGLAKLASE